MIEIYIFENACCKSTSMSNKNLIPGKYSGSSGSLKEYFEFANKFYCCE